MPYYLKFTLTLGVVLLLGACGLRSEETSYYVLESNVVTPVAALDDLDDQEDMAKLKLLKVVIPSYLDRNSIVTRDANGVRLHLANFDSWAEPLDSGTRRIIAEVLTPVLLEKNILLQPLDEDSYDSGKIYVEIRRLDGTLGQNVVLDARFTVRGDNDETIASGAFLEQAPAGLSYATLVQAQSNLLKKLAKAMAKPIIAELNNEVVD